jgi:hypothetical protein
MEFNNLSTVKFQEKMKPYARNIYKKVFPGCEIQDLREKGFKVHILDKEFGIDSLINFESGQWISIQEKYRKNSALKYCDFTQEYMNAVGTKFENKGEWFKLGAQLYFYGWANELENDFQKWVILDVAKYKLIVEKNNGLKNLGNLKNNFYHGNASFYAIPIMKLKDCFLITYKDLLKNE